MRKRIYYPENRICQTCGKEFLFKARHGKVGKYCSLECSYAKTVTIVVTEASKQKHRDTCAEKRKLKALEIAIRIVNSSGIYKVVPL